MVTFNFIATDRFSFKDLLNVEKFVDAYPDFQAVTLKDEKELKVLLELLGIGELIEHKLLDSEFSKYWDLSDFKFPEYDKIEFDEFYSNWIPKSKRNNNMDEYGHLIFLHGLSSRWNKLKYRLIVKEDK